MGFKSQYSFIAVSCWSILDRFGYSPARSAAPASSEVNSAYMIMVHTYARVRTSPLVHFPPLANQPRNSTKQVAS